MDWVLNGKKKAISLVVVAFLLCGVFGGLVVEQSLGFMFGKTSSAGCTWSGVWDGMAGYNNYTFTVLDGYYWEITEFHAFVNGTTGDSSMRFGVFDSSDYLVYASGVVNASTGVNGGWVNATVDCDLMGGSYYFAVFCNDSVRLGYYVTSGDPSAWNQESIADFTNPASRSAWGSIVLCLYVDYDITPFGQSGVNQPEVVSVDASTLGELGLCAFLVAVSVLLALKSRSWAVNFLFGLSLVGFLGWMFANAVVELWGGWLLFMVLVGAVLVLVKGAVLVRSSGV